MTRTPTIQRSPDGGATTNPGGTAFVVPTVLKMGRFVKVSHTLFSLPLVIAGLLIGAGGLPTLRVLLLSLIAAAGARTAAMALNRIIDRKIDARNARTAGRELPSGALSLTQAFGVTLIGTLVYLAAAAALGSFILAISPIPLAVFVGYPYLKRFTPLCHFGVGLALGLAPLAGWLAVRQSWSGSVEILPLLIFGIFWVTGFDVIYATLDIEFDRSHSIHSIPSRLGRDGAIQVSGWLHRVAFLMLPLLWWMHHWSPWSLAPLALVAVLLVLEQRLAANVELAFFRMNIGVGFAVLAFIVAGIFA